jgi:hypothetical protein
VRGAKVMFSRTFKWGKSSNCWKTIVSFCRIAEAFFRFISIPSNITLPAEGVTRPFIVLIRGAFASARGADDSDDLALFDREGDIVEDRLLLKRDVDVFKR